MTRKEIYAKIKEYGLAELIKEDYGKNYTNLSNEDLLNVLDDFESMCNKSTDKSTTLVNIVDNRVDKLVEVLSKKRILLMSEVDYILK